MALGLAGAAAVWLFGVWPPPLWWRDHWPRRTAMMRWTERHLGDTAAVPDRPTPLARISAFLPRMVIIGEDSRFRTHPGLDFAEIGDALGLRPGTGFVDAARTVWRRRDRLRGASTITQQLAKNLYLSPSRDPLRKVKEAVTAVRLELALSKDRVLELYLNAVEFGPGLWGVDAASHAYFGVPPARLTEMQAATLAATLPFPRSSNLRARPARMLARRDLILARYHGVDVYIPPVPEDVEVDSLLVFPISPPTLPLIPPVLESIPVGPVDTTVDTTAIDSTPSRRASGASPAPYNSPDRSILPARWWRLAPAP